MQHDRRRVADSGVGPADEHLVAAARAILSAGARQPEGQPAIAVMGGTVPDGEDVVYRLCPSAATTSPARTTRRSRAQEKLMATRKTSVHPNIGYHIIDALREHGLTITRRR